MPEGDTLYRTAATLQRWIGGREVTEATTAVPGLPVDRIVGQRVQSAEAWGKHLLLRFRSGQVLHTHLRMSGSWHVYSHGDRWRRPSGQARLVLVCGDRVAVCFNAPVVELLAPGAEANHPSLAGLGPDILDQPLDLRGIRRRARLRPPDTPLRELLLYQPVLSGISNIRQCKALFLDDRNPSVSVSSLSDQEPDAILPPPPRRMTVQQGRIG